MLDTTSGRSAQADPFRKLWDLGYKTLLPIMSASAKTYGRGKRPGWIENGQWGGFTGWMKHQTTEADLTSWAAMGCGAGLRLGAGIVAIDADALNPKSAKIIAEAVERRFGLLPKRIGRAPKALYLIRTDEDFKTTNFEFGDHERVEILSGGRQCVMYGIHPLTQKPYWWEREPVRLSALPYAPKAELAAFMAEVQGLLPHASPVKAEGGGAPVAQESLKGDLETVRCAVAAIPNSNANFSRREDYVAVGYAIKAALVDWPDEALEIFEDWCARWKDGENDSDQVRLDWRKMKPDYRRGASWLYGVAEKLCWRDPNGVPVFTEGSVYWEPIPEPEPQPESIFGDNPDDKHEPAGWLGTPYRFPEPSAIPPREFLYGTHYLRDFCSVTVAPTKVGKSSLGIVEALVMTTGKPLLGIEPEGLFRVRIWNGEDPLVEMERRIAAAMQVFGLTPADVGDRLIVDSGRDSPLCIASPSKNSFVVHAETVASVIQALRAQGVDCLIIDPIIKSHSLSENDNTAIDAVARAWNEIAGATHCAIDLIHHSRKLNGNEASIDDARGASALVSAARSARVLARMSIVEARKKPWAKDRYKSLFRFADAVSNMAAARAGSDDEWLEIFSVDLGNGRLSASGKPVKSDRVGVVRALDAAVFKLEPVAQEREDATEARALAMLKKGQWKKSVIADNWAGIAIGQCLGIDSDTEEGKERIKEVIRDWLRAGKLAVEMQKDYRGRPAPHIIVIDLTDKMSEQGLFD